MIDMNEWQTISLAFIGYAYLGLELIIKAHASKINFAYLLNSTAPL